MKTATSEGNLARFITAERGLQVIDPVALNRKIKSMKAALKLSERHNKDLERHNKQLHLQIKSLKEANQIQLAHLQSQSRKYKQLYELRGFELKECRKALKRLEAEQQAQLVEEAEGTAREYRETIVKQEQQLARLREENTLLYDQLYEKTIRVKQLEPLLLKNYSCKNDKDKMFLASLRSALEVKNEEFQKIIQEKTQLAASRSTLEKNYAELSLNMTRLTAELDCERRSAAEVRERLEKECLRLGEELKVLSGKYNELLGFSYEIQKDFERELQLAVKEINRKDSKR